jgi:hypothetical protein
VVIHKLPSSYPSQLSVPGLSPSDGRSPSQEWRGLGGIISPGAGLDPVGVEAIVEKRHLSSHAIDALGVAVLGTGQITPKAIGGASKQSIERYLKERHRKTSF